MGKIRVKTFDDQEQEAKDKRLLAKRAAKKEEKAKEKVSEQEKEVEEQATEQVTEQKAEPEVKAEPEKATKKPQKNKKAFHSKKYDGLIATVDRTKTYSLSEALELLKKLQRSTFDETVELHINTITAGISGNVTLPHGTGKKTKVVIADDKLIAEIEKGLINFDILVATPDMMPKLAKVAKVLGPKGLMPNPKNGTITDNPEALVKKYEGGQTSFKTESKNPLLHLTVGKVSFGNEKLAENIEEMLTAVKKSNIINVTLKSTMSPGIKIRV